MFTSDAQKRGVRVVVADDNAQLRDKVVQLLKPDFEVVGTAADGKAALELVEFLEPEIAILDISMPIMSGIDVAAAMKGNNSKAKVVILTVHDDSDFLKAALRVGVLGYVIKSHMANDLLAAMQAAIEGNKFISPNCALTEGLNPVDNF